MNEYRNIEASAGSSHELAVPPVGGAVALPARSLSDFGVPGEEKGGFDPREIVRVLFRWRWLILICVVVALGIAMAATWLTVPMYRAVASVEINQQPIELMKNSGIEPIAMRDPAFLSTQYGLLRSRTLAARVAQKLNLARDPSVVSQALPAAVREKVAAGVVAGGFSVLPVTNSRLVELSYSSPNPAIAAEIVNAFAENYISSDIERKYDTTADARRFLQNRIASVKSQLEISERALVAYAQEHGIIQISSGGSGEPGKAAPAENNGNSLDTSTLIALNSALAEATNARIAAEEHFHQISQNRGSAEASADTNVQSLVAQRAKLQLDYDQKGQLYKPDFPLMQQLRGQIRAVDAQLGRQQNGQVTAARSDFLAAEARESELRAKVGQLKSTVLDTRGRSIQYNILQREVDTNRTLYDALLQRFKEIGVSSGVGTSIASIVDRADPPTAPYSPRLMNNLILALVGGGLIGVGLAFLVEFIDDTVKSTDDISKKIKITALGAIPALQKNVDFMEAISAPQNPVAEAYFSVCTAIEFATSKGIPKSILLASSRAAEGKSSSAFAIANNFARRGLSVLLIDADMRKPSFHIDNASGGDAIGLANLLASTSAINAHIVRTKVSNLWLMPSGHIPPNPAELLASSRMRDILTECEDAFGVVVVDAPPVMGLADAPILASMCQGTIFVIQASGVRRPAASRAVERLQASGAHLLGGILTKVNAKTSGYGDGYGYGYGYGYSPYAYGAGASDPKRKIELIS